MSIIKHTEREVDLLARLMRAEAIGEGELGMLMVGNVVINRILANCLTFKDIRTITDAVYQEPGGFAAINSPLFNSSPTTREKNLARSVLKGESYYPATNALWFYAPKKGEDCIQYWFDQRFVGKYKSHCFYVPYEGACPELY